MIKKNNLVDRISLNHDREFLFKEFEREIYENITQCLCLAKMQIGRIPLSDPAEASAFIGEANLLIGKAIIDLRNLVNSYKNEIIK